MNSVNPDENIPQLCHSASNCLTLAGASGTTVQLNRMQDDGWMACDLHPFNNISVISV